MERAHRLTSASDDNNHGSEKTVLATADAAEQLSRSHYGAKSSNTVPQREQLTEHAIKASFIAAEDVLEKIRTGNFEEEMAAISMEDKQVGSACGVRPS